MTARDDKRDEEESKPVAPPLTVLKALNEYHDWLVSDHNPVGGHVDGCPRCEKIASLNKLIDEQYNAQAATPGKTPPGTAAQRREESVCGAPSTPSHVAQKPREQAGPCSIYGEEVPSTTPRSEAALLADEIESVGKGLGILGSSLEGGRVLMPEEDTMVLDALRAFTLSATPRSACPNCHCERCRPECHGKEGQ